MTGIKFANDCYLQTIKTQGDDFAEEGLIFDKVQASLDFS